MLKRFIFSDRYQGRFYFILREILMGFRRHNFVALNASIAFFTLFAFIPFVLLVFFFLSQWLSSSAFALEELSNITSLLLPEMNQRIMDEVSKASSQHASWGIIWIMVLFLAATPLTSSIRSGLLNIMGLPPRPAFFKNKLSDIFAVIGIMLLFFIYVFISLYLQQASLLFNQYAPFLEKGFLTGLLSFVLLIGVVTLFFRFYFSIKIEKKYLLMGATLTSLCWLILSNAFEFFVSMSASYGLFFGGMRNIFISFIWLYLNTGALLIGAEVIAAFHKQEILLIKQLFTLRKIYQQPIVNNLLDLFGNKYKKDAIIFEAGDHDQRLFFIIEGEVGIVRDGKIVSRIGPGQYFGELSLLNKVPRIASAFVSSDWAKIIVIPEKQMKILLAEDSKIAMSFLANMAKKLQVT